MEIAWRTQLLGLESDMDTNIDNRLQVFTETLKQRFEEHKQAARETNERMEATRKEIYEWSLKVEEQVRQGGGMSSPPGLGGFGGKTKLDKKD